ncbi:hypothetical protein N7492_001125 [Penicillium capsulatum]|uniref:Uncharacterized protein n=1 Tax=Penicillium capsulatum TaxID=69766 RepID=A0A9W9IR24_9EURO|nr:hypothetical protein N7492_001125 [Penicillium capsulatum]KAJ6129818.1 hypothetical protein N7512_002598 [Penicillium capsulatum]
MASTDFKKSTSAMWRRSTSALSESKDRYHQSTVETYHRSADSWSESKDRCRRTTREMMNRSANSWTESKHRCRQSTLDMVNRSTTRWAESTARLQEQHRALLTSQSIEADAREATTAPQSSQPSGQPTQPIQSMESDQCPPRYSDFEQSRDVVQSERPQKAQPFPPAPTSESPTSLPAETKEPTRPRSISFPSWKIKASSEPKNQKPEEQALAMFESLDQIVAQVVHAKHTRDSKATEMGEIESNWVRSTITNTETSARGLARILQTYRQEMAKSKGKMSSSHRKNWKNKDGLLAGKKQSHLLSHREQLEKVITHLQNRPDNPTVSESSSPTESPLTPEEPTIDSIVEIAESDPIVEIPGSDPVLVAELPAEQPILELDPTPVIAELPSEPAPKTTVIAELSEDAAISRRPLPSVPKIVVTGVSDSPVGTIESPKRVNLSYEVHEINEMLKQTRTDTREQQSESLANIVARMDTTRGR